MALAERDEIRIEEITPQVNQFQTAYETSSISGKLYHTEHDSIAEHIADSAESHSEVSDLLQEAGVPTAVVDQVIQGLTKDVYRSFPPTPQGELLQIAQTAYIYAANKHLCSPEDQHILQDLYAKRVQDLQERATRMIHNDIRASIIAASHTDNPLEEVRTGKMHVLHAVLEHGHLSQEAQEALRGLHAFDTQTIQMTVDRMRSYSMPDLLHFYQMRASLREAYVHTNHISVLDEAVHQLYQEVYSHDALPGVEMALTIDTKDKVIPHTAQQGDLLQTFHQTQGDHTRIVMSDMRHNLRSHHPYTRDILDITRTPENGISIALDRNGTQRQANMDLLDRQTHIIGIGDDIFEHDHLKLLSTLELFITQTGLPLHDAIQMVQYLCYDHSDQAIFTILRYDGGQDRAIQTDRTPEGVFDAGLLLIDTAVQANLIPAAFTEPLHPSLQVILDLIQTGTMQLSAAELHRLAQEVVKESPRIAEVLRRMQLTVLAEETQALSVQDLMNLLAPLVQKDILLPHGKLVIAQRTEEGLFSQEQLQRLTEMSSILALAQTEGDTQRADRWRNAIQNELLSERETPPAMTEWVKQLGRYNESTLIVTLNDITHYIQTVRTREDLMTLRQTIETSLVANARNTSSDQDQQIAFVMQTINARMHWLEAVYREPAPLRRAA